MLVACTRVVTGPTSLPEQAESDEAGGSRGSSLEEIWLSAWPVWGAHVPYGSKRRMEVRPEGDLIRDLGIRATTVWLYPRPGGEFDVERSANLVRQVQAAAEGLAVYVQIMPNAKAEAREAADMEGDERFGFGLPSNMDAYLRSLESLARELAGRVDHFSIGNEFSGLNWGGGVADYWNSYRGRRRR